MNKVILGLFLVSNMAAGAMCADSMEQKAQKMVQSVEEGCKVEFTTFCKDVTPGEGRRLACLYAFQDKLTGQCEYALYDAATKLEKAVVQLSHLANECATDIDTYCGNVEIGQGRIINCLKKQKKTSANCKAALKQIDSK